jgi:hypothetical protein
LPEGVDLLYREQVSFSDAAEIGVRHRHQGLGLPRGPDELDRKAPRRVDVNHRAQISGPEGVFRKIPDEYYGVVRFVAHLRPPG